IMNGPGIPGPDRRGRPYIARDVLHVMDLAPTFLELAGVAHPPSHRGRAVAPLQGHSLAGYLRGRAPGPHDWQGFAYANMAAVRQDRWKLVRMPRPFGTGRWRLYRLDHDPAELFDRAAARPRRAKELTALWERYAQANGVILPAEEPPQKPSPSER
ncbi:MAG: sulfatase/phosphatase domain-containing protein, partial [Myxococcota bacterium]